MKRKSSDVKVIPKLKFSFDPILDYTHNYSQGYFYQFNYLDRSVSKNIYNYITEHLHISLSNDVFFHIFYNNKSSFIQYYNNIINKAQFICDMFRRTNIREIDIQYALGYDCPHPRNRDRILALKRKAFSPFFEDYVYKKRNDFYV